MYLSVIILTYLAHTGHYFAYLAWMLNIMTAIYDRK